MNGCTVFKGGQASVKLNGRELCSAESIEIRSLRQLYSVRQCFSSDTVAVVKGNGEHKIILSQAVMSSPIKNMNLFDLDNFMLEITLDDRIIVCEGCVWGETATKLTPDKVCDSMTVICLKRLEMNGKDGQQ